MATCNIVVMEYCDKGSLRHAIKRGVFHKRLSSTSVAVDLCAIVQVRTACGRGALKHFTIACTFCAIASCCAVELQARICC